MDKYDKPNKYAYLVYFNIPFLYELKTIADWTFTRTALDLFQWLKMGNVHSEIFLAKCTNKVYIEHPLGEK